MTLLFLTACEEKKVEEVNLSLDYESINRVVMTSGIGNLDLETPFDTDSKNVIEDIIQLLTSTTYMKEVKDNGECDGGNDIRYHLYTNEGVHYELLDVSISNNGKCSSLLLVKKNDEVFGYSKDISNTLNDLFSNLLDSQ